MLILGYEHTSVIGQVLGAQFRTAGHLDRMSVFATMIHDLAMQQSIYSRHRIVAAVDIPNAGWKAREGICDTQPEIERDRGRLV